MREAETMDLTLDVLYFSTYFNEHAWLYNSKNWRNRRTTGKLGFGRQVWLLSGLPGSGRVHALCRPSSVRGRECLRSGGAGGILVSWLALNNLLVQITCSESPGRVTVFLVQTFFAGLWCEASIKQPSRANRDIQPQSRKARSKWRPSI